MAEYASSSSVKDVTRLRRMRHGNLSILQQVLHLRDSTSSMPESWSNAVIVSIDFENLDAIRVSSAGSPKCQVGVTIFDPSDLLTEKGPETRSYHACTAGLVIQRYTRQKFIWHDTVSLIDNFHMLLWLNQHIPEGCPLLLSGYELTNDIQVLQHIGFDLSRFVGVLDTRYFGQSLFSGTGMSLEKLCSRLSADASGFHNAGNDAYYSLRCLLLIAIRTPTTKSEIAGRIATYASAGWQEQFARKERKHCLKLFRVLESWQKHHASRSSANQPCRVQKARKGRADKVSGLVEHLVDLSFLYEEDMIDVDEVSGTLYSSHEPNGCHIGEVTSQDATDSLAGPQ